MKGIDEYTQKNENQIEVLIKKNPDIKCLKGFANHLKLNKSETTIYNYLRHVIDFIHNLEEGKGLADLEYDDYIEYENKFVSLTSSYRIVKHSALKAFSEYLFITKKNPADVMKGARAPKMFTSVETLEKREHNYLDYDELHVYFGKVAAGVGSHKARERQKPWRSRDIAIITMLVNTGMRCSALYKLDVEDINFETQEVHIKEKGKVQMYYLNDNVMEALEVWLRDRQYLLDGKEESALFVSNQLRRMSLKAISNMTQKYGKNVKDINLTPHKFRATFGTQVYASTGDLYLTKEAMGHSNTSTTEIYIRGQHKESKIKAAQAMQAFCG